MGERPPQRIREIAARQVERLAEVIAGLSDADLVAPTLCDGWLVAHLLAHIRFGLVEQATSFAEPAGPDDAIDRDYVSYWRDFPPGNRPATYGAVRFLWATASAYLTADGIREHLADTARQAAGLSRQAPAGSFRFQGHVMAAEDILAMWAVEWVIHQLDLTVRLPGARLVPTDESLTLAVAAIDELTGSPVRPPTWDQSTYVLKGTGRLSLDDTEGALLGDRARAFPAFG